MICILTPVLTADLYVPDLPTVIKETPKQRKVGKQKKIQGGAKQTEVCICTIPPTLTTSTCQLIFPFRGQGSLGSHVSWGCGA